MPSKKNVEDAVLEEETVDSVAEESKEETKSSKKTPKEKKAKLPKEKKGKTRSKKKNKNEKEEPAADTTGAEENEVETFSEVLEQTMPKRRRYTSRNTRRGRYRFAAWLGLVVILLAIVGLLSLVSAGIGVIRKANDHTDLTTELYDTAYPLIQYQPTSFASIEEADQSVLLQAAIFRITEAERVRQLREKADESKYDLDKYGRMIVSVDEINESFATLYGPDLEPQHQTLGDTSGKSYTYEYDKANACYYVPMSVSSSLYTTMHDGYRHSQGATSIRVGYALTANLSTDSYGNTLSPTAKDVEYYQWYTFIEDTEGVWKIVSITDE